MGKYFPRNILHRNKRSVNNYFLENRYINKLWGGIKPGGPYQCLRWAQGPIQGKPTPWPWEGSSSAMGRTLLVHKCSRGQREQFGPGDDISGHFAE